MKCIVKYQAKKISSAKTSCSELCAGPPAFHRHKIFFAAPALPPAPMIPPMFQSTSGTVRRMTPPRLRPPGGLPPSLKGEASNHKGNFDETR
jgi:hypothetical protein